ncbi:unnamed protein product [Linum trigynum]|uniref:Uncharacterized protein n=1 Tax=Linum trigynum TaxID=586398 RepID=A0AAV2EV32_9ROSI
MTIGGELWNAEIPSKALLEWGTMLWWERPIGELVGVLQLLRFVGKGIGLCYDHVVRKVLRLWGFGE